MSSRLVISIGTALVILGASAWVAIPPFPPPAALMDTSFAALTARLGHPTGSIATKFVVWEKSRGIAVWSLEVGYDSATLAPMELPHSISRSLWFKWAGVSIPYGYATRARVMARASAGAGKQEMEGAG
jgi:hypothetical protein